MSKYGSMVLVYPGNHLKTELRGELLVCSTSPVTITAGDLLIDDDGLERIGMTGTLASGHIGKVAVLGTWSIDRMAEAMTRTLHIPKQTIIYNLEDDLLASTEPFVAQEF